MVQSIGLVMLWIGGAFLLGNITPTDQMFGVQIAWFIFAMGYGLLHGYAQEPRNDQKK